MSFGMNRVELIGRLGADVTVNHLASGVTYEFMCQWREGVLPVVSQQPHRGAPPCHSALRRSRVYRWPSRS